MRQTSNQSSTTNGWIGFWVAGIPGSGKTTLVRAVCDIIGCDPYDSDDERFSRYRIGRSTRETADLILAYASAESDFVSCSSVSFPGSSRVMKVGLMCPAILAMRRKPSAYGAWLGSGVGGDSLDSWTGLADAHVVLSAARPVVDLAREVVERLSS